MAEQKADEKKTQGIEARTYESPTVVDYGDIFEITAGSGGTKIDMNGQATGFNHSTG